MPATVVTHWQETLQLNISENLEKEGKKILHDTILLHLLLSLFFFFPLLFFFTWNLRLISLDTAYGPEKKRMAMGSTDEHYIKQELRQ